MKSEDGTGGRRPLLGDVDCHPPISFKFAWQITSVICFLYCQTAARHSPPRTGESIRNIIIATTPHLRFSAP